MRTRNLLLVLTLVCSLMLAIPASSTVLLSESFPYSLQQDINTDGAYRQGLGGSTLALPILYKESDTSNYGIWLWNPGMAMVNDSGNSGLNRKNAGVLYDFKSYDGLKYTIVVNPAYGNGYSGDLLSWAGFTIAGVDPNTSQGGLGSSLGFKIAKSGAWAAYDFNSTPFATGTVAGTANGLAGLQYTITATLKKSGANYLYSISINDGTDHVLVTDHVVSTTFATNYINLLSGNEQTAVGFPEIVNFASLTIETIAVEPPVIEPPTVTYNTTLLAEAYPWSIQQDINTSNDYRQGLGGSSLPLPVMYKESNTAEWGIFLWNSGLAFSSNSGNSGLNRQNAGVLYDFKDYDYLKYTIAVNPASTAGYALDLLSWAGFTIAGVDPNTSQGGLGSSLGFKISKSGAWAAYDFNSTPFATGTVAGTPAGSLGLQYTITAKLEKVGDVYLYSISINDGSEQVLVENHVVSTAFATNYLNLLAGSEQAEAGHPDIANFASLKIETEILMPTIAYSDDITIDGNLSDWADANWIDETFAYFPATGLVNSDMTSPQVAWKWGAGGTKLYMAARVQDSYHVFTDTYIAWNKSDRIETQIWASSQSGVINQATSDISQQYEFGLKANGIDTWSGIIGGNAIPASANFQHAVKTGADGWIYYEAALTPFEAFNRVTSETTPKIMVAGDLIGADACIGSINSISQFNMAAINSMQNKYNTTDALAKWTLSRAGVQGTIDLLNYNADVFGQAGTVTITDGVSTETHKIVIDTDGLFTFTTALRGACTATAKVGHWLAKAGTVTVDADGNGTVNFSLTNGDAVDSNEVDWDDYNAVVDAFGSLPGDSNWNANADLDGTGEVDWDDFNIAVDNFGAVGE